MVAEKALYRWGHRVDDKAGQDAHKQADQSQRHPLGRFRSELAVLKQEADHRFRQKE